MVIENGELIDDPKQIMLRQQFKVENITNISVKYESQIFVSICVRDKKDVGTTSNY
jgi:hypothetical protein